jgi:Type VI secretion system/phage-baseplate injector OB domain
MTGSIDQTKLKKAFSPKEIHIRCAQVLSVEEDDDDGVVDVKLEIWPDQTISYAELAPGYAGAGFGDWWLPAVGDVMLVGNCSKHDNDIGEAFVISGLWSSNAKKPSGATTDKRRIVIRDGDTLEVKVSGGGVLQMDVSGAGGVNITTENQDIKVDAGTGTVDIQGTTVKGTATGSGEKALAFQSEVNGNVVAYNPHTHPVPMVGTSGPPSAPMTPPVGTVNLKGT